jgi:hypothetical protein
MDFKFFLSGLKNIIISPVKAWETIDSENRPAKIIRDSFFLPLLVIVAISAIAGSMLFINTELSPLYSLFTGIKWFLTILITVYLTSFILGEITFPLDLGKNFSVSFRLIVYSITPFLLCLILSRLFESLLFINIIGLYGLYIFWTGSEKLLTPPHYKKMPLLIATTITLAAIYILTGILLNMLTDRIYFAFFA